MSIHEYLSIFRKERKTMETVSLLKLQQLINKAKYVYSFSHALDCSVEVKKGHIKEIVKTQLCNTSIDPNGDYCLVEVDDDELWIDQL